MKTVALLAAFCTLSACTIIPPANGPLPPSTDSIARAALGHKVYVDGPSVTPLAVIEDSRCPAEVQCVWAGRVRISARIDLGARSEERELTLHQPIQVADGSLELVEVTPARTKEAAIPSGDYRFGFRFMGGI